ncbi:uncharacterized protein LOC120254177 [Dioscorea cayenensis subsp. rotundata]|uniref:Uncharacterized protein LOC120254177 n=1 Tax=Dioscorea cayennensis subsp. rotundata TaxID=55577 RepID=A0AB40AT30_DIOCR|nr:uncharacterized protein LOC120254177 [Dioscorea cayenensis subsp. rotundata]
MPRCKNFSRRPGMRPRGEGESSCSAAPSLDFSDKAQLKRYERLSTRQFGDLRTLDYAVLESIGLAERVRQLLSVGAWDKFFSVQETVYREIVLEFLATFDFDLTQLTQINMSSSKVIQFRAYGVQYQMSVTEFSIALGLYELEFTRTFEYSNLFLELPVHITPSEYWRKVSRETVYNPARSKAAQLRDPAVRVVHALLSRSLSGLGESSGVVSTRDILFLWSMVEGVPIHLGYAVAYLIWHQAQDPRVAVLFCGPYIMRLLRGLGVLTVTEEMQSVGGFVSLSMETLRAMGVVQRRQKDRGVVYRLVRAPEPGAELEESESESESETHSSGHADQAAATELPISNSRPSRAFSSRDRFSALEKGVEELRSEQRETRAEVRAELQEVRAELREVRAELRDFTHGVAAHFGRLESLIQQFLSSSPSSSHRSSPFASPSPLRQDPPTIVAPPQDQQPLRQDPPTIVAPPQDQQPLCQDPPTIVTPPQDQQPSTA